MLSRTQPQFRPLQSPQVGCSANQQPRAQQLKHFCLKPEAMKGGVKKSFNFIKFQITQT